MTEEPTIDVSEAVALHLQQIGKRKPAPFGTLQILSFAWAGTAIAGGLYPAALLSCRLLISTVKPSWDDFGFLVPGFIFGFLYAGTVALPVTLFAWVCVLISRTKRTPIWLGSLIGGWTGFICTLHIGQMFPDGFPLHVWIAVALGQVGAGMVAWLGLRANRRARGELPKTPQPLRVSMSQLFSWTTAACLLAASLGALRLSHEQNLLVIQAACLQATILLVAKLCSLVSQRRTSPNVPENAGSST